MTSYPLVVGSQWHYQIEVLHPSAPGQFVCNYEVMADTTIMGSMAKAIKVTQIEGSESFVGRRWLTHIDTGLVLLATSGSGSAMLFKQASFSGVLASSLMLDHQSSFSEQDSIYVAEHPLYFLQFPMQLGQNWYVNQHEPVLELRMKRRWEGFYTVVTEAGSFDCIKLEHFWDVDGNGYADSDQFLAHQYISPQYGIIFETLYGKVDTTGNGERLPVWNASLVDKNF